MAAHLRWLATVKLAHSAQQIAFQEYLDAITQAGERIARLEQALRDALVPRLLWIKRHRPPARSPAAIDAPRPRPSSDARAVRR